MLVRLDEFIRELKTAALIAERVDTVEQLASSMRTSQAIVRELDTKYKFNSIRIAHGDGRKAFEFRRVRDCVELFTKYYERLAHYKTIAGKADLRGIVSVTIDLDRKGDVNVRAHHFDERIDPLASLRSWSYMAHYLPWAQKKYKADSDPVDHIVEFLIQESEREDRLVQDFLNGKVTDARLDSADDVGRLLDVEVRTHVPGDDRFARPGPPRMWTYQVKIPDGSELGTWVWSTEAWSKRAITLPILRVVHTEVVASKRHVPNDFTRGTLYAMKGPSTMRCFPSSKFHSALFGSEVTSAAGMLVAEDGRVLAIDNRSGHYQPGHQQLQTAVQFLSQRLLFDADAFVSVYVTDQDALYFSPAGFLEAAQSGMNFRVVAGLVARRASEFNEQLPVASRLASLIPMSLAKFPVHSGANRWDRMLAMYYGGKLGLKAVVTDFKKALQLATSWSARPGDLRTQRETDHVSLASRVLKAIDAGGAYCHLPEFVRQLVVATQPIGQTVPKLADANLRYREFATRLATLKPDRTPF